MQGLQLQANTSGLSMAFSYKREKGGPRKEQEGGRERNGGYENTSPIYEIAKNKNLNEKNKEHIFTFEKKSYGVPMLR